MQSSVGETAKSPAGKFITTSDLITLIVGCITILITILVVAIEISESLMKRKNVCFRVFNIFCEKKGE
jgi:hypothetical protein